METPTTTTTTSNIDLLEEEKAGRCDHAGATYYVLLKSIDQNRLKNIPKYLCEVIENQAWKKWRWIGNEFSAIRLEDYITKHPPNGLGVTVDLIKRLLADNKKALEQLEHALRGEDAEKIDAATPDLNPLGSNQFSDGPDTQKNNIRAYGTSNKYAIAKLRKDRPDIHARVLTGELSPHAGMIEAGFRKKSVRKKLSWVEREQRRIEKRHKSERRAIWLWLEKEFG